MSREPRIYAPAERPDVIVRLPDGTEAVGELRAWFPVGDDEWEAQVSWRPAGTTTRQIDRFAAGDVRPDMSVGRSTVEP